MFLLYLLDIMIGLKAWEVRSIILYIKEHNILFD